MGNQSGWTTYLQVFGIIAAVYVIVIATGAITNRLWLTHRRKVIATHVQPMIRMEGGNVQCPRCLYVVSALYRVGIFGPCCYACCARFTFAAGRDHSEITPNEETAV